MDFDWTNLLVALKWPALIVQMILSPILILLVLLQSGKGDDLGSAFSGGGGGSSSVLGTGGASKFLVRFTVIFVTLFMLNSILLAKIFKVTSESSVSATIPEPLAPAANAIVPNAITAPQGNAIVAPPAKPTAAPVSVPKK